jgi:hypothetical protein
MKKYILLAVFALVALASAAQTTEGDHLVTVLEDSIMQAEAEQQAYNDSVMAALDYQYATQKITLMADDVVLLDTLKCRPVLVIDSNNNFYATLGKYAVMFERLQGRMWNRQNEEVRMNLIKGKAPEISFRNVKTDVAVDPSTIK